MVIREKLKKVCLVAEWGPIGWILLLAEEVVT
jgi:hypothetical protein